MSIWLRILAALQGLRGNRLAVELRGLRRATEALVQLQAFALGVPNPLTQPRGKSEPPAVDVVADGAGQYVLAEQRGDDYRARHGKLPQFDQDFVSAPAEDDRGDRAARGRSVTVYPEDRASLRAGLDALDGGPR